MLSCIQYYTQNMKLIFYYNLLYFNCSTHTQQTCVVFVCMRYKLWKNLFILISIILAGYFLTDFILGCSMQIFKIDLHCLSFCMRYKLCINLLQINIYTIYIPILWVSSLMDFIINIDIHKTDFALSSCMRHKIWNNLLQIDIHIYCTYPYQGCKWYGYFPTESLTERDGYQFGQFFSDIRVLFRISDI